jgi:hypothetical protein
MDRLSDSGEEVLENSQGKSRPSLTVRGCRERASGQSRQVGAGGVAVKNLKEEQVDGGDRIKNSISPSVTDSRTRPADGCGSERGSDIVADPPQRGEE